MHGPPFRSVHPALPAIVAIITPRACARGKAIVYRHRRRRHENRQISRSRHLCVKNWFVRASNCSKHIIYNFILFYVIFLEKFPKYLRDLLKKVTYVERASSEKH